MYFSPAPLKGFFVIDLGHDVREQVDIDPHQLDALSEKSADTIRRSRWR